MHELPRLTTRREAGRARLIEDHKLKRENEETHRAALYVPSIANVFLTNRCSSLPGLLGNTPLLRVR